MALKLGSTNVTDVYLGSVRVMSVYLGSVLVWERGSEPQSDALLLSGTAYGLDGTYSWSASSVSYVCTIGSTTYQIKWDSSVPEWVIQTLDGEMTFYELYGTSLTGDVAEIIGTKLWDDFMSGMEQHELTIEYAQQPDVLPDAYTAVDYIICTGAQYLDTGLKASATGKYQVRAQHTDNTKVNALLGDGNSKTDSNLGLWMNGGVSGTGYGTQAVFGNGNNSGYFINEAKGSYPARQLRTYELDVASHTYTIDGVVEGTTTSVGAFANSKKLVLGACWRSNSVVSGSYFTGNIHFFKAWEGSTLVCNMVPCIKKDGNVPGMYDFVTKAFFGSATATPFGVPVVITIVQSTVNVSGNAGVALTSLDLADSAYTTISPSGTRSFSASVLPTGVSLTTAGVLSGTPSWGFHRESTVTVSASGAESKTLTLVFSIATTEQQVTMTVSENPISISGTVGTPMSIALSDYVTTSNATYMGFVPNSDTLPQGLTLNSAGIISGTPTTAGSTTYTINFIASGNTVEEGVSNSVSELVTIQFSIADQPSGLDEDTAEQVSLAYGNGVWLGDVPATEEEAVHQALLEE